MTDEDIAWLDLVTLASLIRKRELTSVQVTEAQLRRISRLNPSLHA